jgi:hypothetical protein
LITKFLQLPEKQSTEVELITSFRRIVYTTKTRTGGFTNQNNNSFGKSMIKKDIPHKQMNRINSCAFFFVAKDDGEIEKKKAQLLKPPVRVSVVYTVRRLVIAGEHINSKATGLDFAIAITNRLS